MYHFQKLTATSAPNNGWTVKYTDYESFIYFQVIKNGVTLLELMQITWPINKIFVAKGTKKFTL